MKETYSLMKIYQIFTYQIFTTVALPIRLFP